MKKAFLEKILAMGMVIAVFMTGNMYAYAGYHETTSNHTYAGDTRWTISQHMHIWMQMMNLRYL